MFNKNECHKKQCQKNHKKCDCKTKKHGKHSKHDVWDKKQLTVLVILLAVLLTGGLAIAGYFAWKNLQIFADELE